MLLLQIIDTTICVQGLTWNFFGYHWQMMKKSWIVTSLIAQLDSKTH